MDCFNEQVMVMKVKDTINYSDKVPDILSAQELANSVDKKIEYFYRYKAHYYWIDPYDCGDTGYYLIAYANDITKLQDYCHSKGYDKNVDVHCIGGYEIVDIKKSFQKGQKYVVDKNT